MQLQITETTKADFQAACKKLNITNDLPEVSKLRPDYGLYLTAKYMLVVLIEAEKEGEIYDTTNHHKKKYEPVHYSAAGYIPGSGSGFSFVGSGGYGYGHTSVGARLSSNSSTAGRENAEKYQDLWEIIMLNFR